MPKIKDLTGQKFGKLTVIKQSEIRKNNKVTWECKCDCGNPNIVYVNTSNLNNGGTKSCGCIKRKRQQQWGASTLIDLVGQKFGELTVLERDFQEEEKRKQTSKKVHPIWKCQCSCGNITSVFGSHLKSGNIKSCGCIFSHGNQKILNILQKNNIPYRKELTIRYNGKVYRYDFAILNKEDIICLIEYDGFQHFYYNNRGWNTKENFQKQQEKDKIKNEYAKINNIPLLRIPYTDFEILSFNYLKDKLKELNISIW